MPDVSELATTWLAGQRWVAEVSTEDGARGVGWTAVSPASSWACYAGVGETSVTETARGRGVGTALLRRQVAEADARLDGVWRDTVLLERRRTDD